MQQLFDFIRNLRETGPQTPKRTYGCCASSDATPAESNKRRKHTKNKGKVEKDKPDESGQEELEEEQDEHAQGPVIEPASILKPAPKFSSSKGADAASPASNPRPLATPCRRFQRKKSTDDCEVVVLGTGKSKELQELEEIMAQIAVLEKTPSPYMSIAMKVYVRASMCCVCLGFSMFYPAVEVRYAAKHPDQSQVRSRQP